MSEHFDDLRSVTASSNLREHCDNVHNGVLVEFGCKVIKSCPRDPLTRQLVEAAKIDGHTGMSGRDQQVSGSEASEVS